MLNLTYICPDQFWGHFLEKEFLKPQSKLGYSFPLLQMC